MAGRTDAGGARTPRDTVAAERTLLAVARTTASLNRILDVLPVVADDFRVQVCFTVDPGSGSGAGLAEQVAALGFRTIPWGRPPDRAVHLVVVTSGRSDLGWVPAPLLRLPHGAGYHKLGSLDDADDDAEEPPAPGRRPAVVRGGGPPVRVVLSHEDQRPLLRAVDPQAAARAVVAGDPGLDRLTASLGLRDRCRAALGLGRHQRVVAITSTWGPRSCFGRHPELAARALAELPHDEFRVVAAFHPNIWARHGPLQVRLWLDRARDAGLVLLPPTGPWQMALLAADCVVGDHGSLTMYALALGRPVVLAAFGAEEVVPGTVMAELGRRLPRLGPDEPLAGQIDKAIAVDDPAESLRLAEGVFAHRGRSLAILQDLVYELMDLAPPGRPPRHEPVPVAEPPRRRPVAFHVETLASPGTGGRTAGVTVRRFPAVVADAADRPAPRHLVVEDVAREPALAESAAVLVRHPGTEAPDPEELVAWADSTLARFPGCRIAAAVGPAGEVLAAVRGRGRVRARLVDAPPGLDPAVAVSGLYAYVLAEGPPAAPARFDLRCGGLTGVVAVDAL